MDMEKIYIFRIIHLLNIPHILEYVLTRISSTHANQNYISIGDSSLIHYRHKFILPNGKKLGDYIPFYFGIRMPMLYVIQNGFNDLDAINPENIVYCVSSVNQILLYQLPFLFTDGHAVDKFTEYYSKKDVVRLPHLIDLKSIKSKYWKSEDDLDLKRRKEAEFLVGSDVPYQAILGWVTFNEIAQKKLLELGIPTEKIAIKPNYYF